LKIQAALEWFSCRPGSMVDQFRLEWSGFGATIIGISGSAAEIGANEDGDLRRSGGIASAQFNQSTRLTRRRLEHPKLN